VRFHTLTVCPAFTRWGTIADPILPTPIKPTFIEVFPLTALVTSGTDASILQRLSCTVGRLNYSVVFRVLNISEE